MTATSDYEQEDKYFDMIQDIAGESIIFIITAENLNHQTDLSEEEDRAYEILSSPMKQSEKSLGKRKDVSEPSTSDNPSKIHKMIGPQLQYNPTISDGPVVIVRFFRLSSN